MLTHRNNLGVALVDVMRLNQNGPDQEYSIDGLRSLIWQPVWMHVKLSGYGELTAAEQAAQAAEDKQKELERLMKAEPLLDISEVKEGKPPGTNE